MHLYNLFGSGWSQEEADKHCAKLKNIKWVIDGQEKDSFYPNHAIEKVFLKKKTGKEYAWINESKSIDSYSYKVLDYRFGEYLYRFDKIFTHDKNIYSQFKNAHFVPLSCLWIKEPKIYKKTKLVSMISSNKLMCQGHLIRLEWVNKLKSKLDLYGKGFNPILKKEEGLADYMFSVAIENDVYESCFTEKILDCFATGTIPIYLGPPDIGDFFNLDGIIILNEDFDINSLTPELYYSKIEAVKDNFERVKEYDFVEDYMYRKYLISEQ